MKSLRLLVLVPLLTTVLSSCATCIKDQPPPIDPNHAQSYIPKARIPTKRSPGAVIQIALAYAKKKKVDLSEYESPVTGDPIVLLGRVSWTVHFSGKGVVSPDGNRISAIGDHFTIIIDDETGYADLMGGM
jgi:hypothetical protein